MSVIIPQAYLTDQEKSRIISDLALVPKETYYSKKFNKNTYYSNQNKQAKSEPVNFYLVDDTNIILPYSYAKCIKPEFLQYQFNKQPTLDLSFNPNLDLYEVQKPIAYAALEQLKMYNTTTLNVFTAFGKTVVTSWLTCMIKGLTLILLTREPLIKQWKSTYEEFTNATGKIWVVGETPPQVASVIICMDGRFDKLPKAYVRNIKTVVIDEAHEFCTPSRVSCLLGTTPSYVIAATATLNRTDKMESMIYAICGLHKVFKISDKPFIVTKYHTGISVPIKHNKQGDTDWTSLVTDLCNVPERNGLILELIRMNPGEKILVLSLRNNHVKLLHQYLLMMGEQVDFMVGNKKRYRDSRVLVGGIKKIGTGFDEKAACDDFNGIRISLLFIVGGIRSTELLEQVAGRVFRSEFPKIIHFVDNMSITENQWRDNEKWYTSRNGKIYICDSPYAIANKQNQIARVSRDIDTNSLVTAQVQSYLQTQSQTQINIEY